MKNKRKVYQTILFIILLIVGLTMMLPFIWTLSASFKHNKDIFSYPIKWIPETFVWENYKKVWTEVPFLQYYINKIGRAHV